MLFDENMPLIAGMGYENSVGLVSGPGFVPRKIDTVKSLQDTYPSNRPMFLGSFEWIYCQWKKRTDSRHKKGNSVRTWNDFL